jgi:hypothetical protein
VVSVLITTGEVFDGSNTVSKQGGGWSHSSFIGRYMDRIYFKLAQSIVQGSFHRAPQIRIVLKCITNAYKCAPGPKLCGCTANFLAS